MHDILFSNPKCSVSVTLQQHTFLFFCSLCVYVFPLWLKVYACTWPLAQWWVPSGLLGSWQGYRPVNPYCNPNTHPAASGAKTRKKERESGKHRVCDLPFLSFWMFVRWQKRETCPVSPACDCIHTPIDQAVRKHVISYKSTFCEKRANSSKNAALRVHLWLINFSSCVSNRNEGGEKHIWSALGEVFVANLFSLEVYLLQCHIYRWH